MSTGLVLARVCAQRGIPTVRQQGTIASRTPLYARRMLDTTHAQVGYNSNSTATSVWSPQCCQLLGRCKNPDNTIRQPPQPSHYAGSRVFQCTRAPINGGGGRTRSSRCQGWGIGPCVKRARQNVLLKVKVSPERSQ